MVSDYLFGLLKEVMPTEVCKVGTSALYPRTRAHRLTVQLGSSAGVIFGCCLIKVELQQKN